MIKEIANSLESAELDEVKKLCLEALASGIPAKSILDDGLIKGMSMVGDKFREGDIYIPEVLIAAENMKAGMSVLQNELVSLDIKPVGRVVIGTVKNDLHDIGKNIVSMMFVGAGFEVFDLGMDQDETAFVNAVKEYSPDILGLSALLTSTMKEMEKVINALVSAGVRDTVQVYIGGAPVTEDYAREIGADCYAEDATMAAKLAQEYILKRKVVDS